MGKATDRQKMLRNVLSPVFSQLVSIIMNLTVPQMLIREYGSAINGLFSTVAQFEQFMHLLEGGIAVSAAASMYALIRAREWQGINEIGAGMRKYYDTISYVCVALVLGLACYMTLTVKEIAWYEVFMLTVLTGIPNFCSLKFSGRYNVLLVADGKAYVKNNAVALIRLFTVIGQIVLIHFHTSVMLIKAWAALAMIVGVVILVRSTKKAYPEYTMRSEHPVTLKSRWYALTMQAAELVKRSLPTVLTSMMFGLKAASVVSVYTALFHIGSSLLEMVSQSFAAFYQKGLSGSEEKQKRRLILFSDALIIMLEGVMAVCFMVLTMPFVGVYTKGVEDVNYLVFGLTVLFVISEGFCNLSFTAKTVLLAANGIKDISVVSIAEVCVSVVVALLGGAAFGYVGVMLGPAAGSLVRYALMQIKMEKNIFGRVSARVLLERALRLLPMIAIVAASSVIHVQARGYVQWFLKAVIVGAAALAVFGALTFATSKETRGLILRKLNRRR